MGLSLGSILSSVSGIPIVGDLLGAGAEHASAKHLQNDSQAHDAQMFTQQAQHDKDMFKLESDFNAREALNAYNREREFAKDMPLMQVEGLKKAGLNPMLAATGGFRAASGGDQQASAKASSSAKGSGGGSPPGARLVMGETAKRYAETELLKEQRNTEKVRQGLIAEQSGKTTAEIELVNAEVDRAKSEARYKDASTESVLMDNVKKANLANVYDDAFGQFLTYSQEIGLGKILALGAMVLGPAAFARFIAGKVAKQHLPKIMSLGRRFWKPGAAREFTETMNKLRGK